MDFFRRQLLHEWEFAKDTRYFCTTAGKRIFASRVPKRSNPFPTYRYRIPSSID